MPSWDESLMSGGFAPWSSQCKIVEASSKIDVKTDHVAFR